MIRITPSTDAGLAQVRQWLQAEHRETGEGFLVNLAGIERAHKEERLLLGVECETNDVVAFQFGGLIHPGILVVRPDKRGNGIGSEFVRYCVQQAQEANACVLHIQCKPSHSIKFWKRMGFTLFSEAYGERCPSDYKNHAFRVLDKQFNLSPHTGTPVDVDIAFRTAGGHELARLQTTGMLQQDGRVLLPSRLVSYCPSHVRGCSDTYVSITIAGQAVYDGKANYPGSTEVGVNRIVGGVFYIDEVVLPVALAQTLGAVE